MIENVKYTKSGVISAEFDGIQYFVPDDMNNRHRREIQEWVESGGKIEEYRDPPPTSNQINDERDLRRTIPIKVELKNLDPILVQIRDKDISNLIMLDTQAKSKIASKDKSTMIFHDADNVDHELTPTQMVELVSVALAAVSNIMDKSWILKAMNPIPEDYADDKYWV